MLYSIVIPCYNSANTIREVVEKTAAEMTRLDRVPFEFVLAEDYSPDNGATLAELKALAEEYDYVTVIELARNSGQHNATMAALNYANGDVIISMDDDGQTDPSQLDKLLCKLEENYDIVFGYYPDKKHSGFRNFGSWVNYMSVRVLIGKPREMKTSSYWVIRRFVRDYIIQYRSPYTHLQGLFLRTVSTDRIASVPIEHHERISGTSNYTFKKLIGLWSNIMGFSIVPLRLAQRIGSVLSIAGLIGAVIVFVRKLLNPAIVLGWSSMMVAMLFFSGIIILFLGIIGEYIGRLFQNVGNTPQFVVKNTYHREGAKDNKQ